MHWHRGLTFDINLQNCNKFEAECLHSRAEGNSCTIYYILKFNSSLIEYALSTWCLFQRKEKK